MGKLVAGAVVVVPFPFSDLTNRKMRPAVVVASFSRGDVLLCQVTSKRYSHPEVVALRSDDFLIGGPLPVDSWILPHRLVTAHEDVVDRTLGILAPASLAAVRAAIVRAICDSSDSTAG